MPTLHLICGLPGAGKTTLAKELEAQHAAVRLCPDEWIIALLPPDYFREERDRLRDPVEGLQWKLAERLLTLGVDTIIEWGLWGRSEREELRDRARALGAAVKLHYLDVSFDELLRRVEERNRDLPFGSFYISAADMQAWSELFEPPGEDELASYDM